MLLGNKGLAALIAPWTSRAASSMFLFIANSRKIRLLPSELLELIEFKPEILPKDRSSGVATLDAIVSGLAPDRLAFTVIIGIDICGKGATGKKM